MPLGHPNLFSTAAGQGLEPQYSPPEGDVLPLDEPAMNSTIHPSY